MIDNTILVALIAAGAGLTGSISTVLFNYFTTRNKKVEDKHRLLIIQLSKDIIAFHQLEDYYADTFAGYKQTTKLSVKRQYRKKLRDMGIETPGKNATISVAEKRIKDYTK